MTFVLVIAVISFIALVAAWKLLGQTDKPNDLLCSSKNGPQAHVILLVDKTDPPSFTQKKAIHQILDEFAKGKYASEGALLSVFVLGEDFRETAEPIFEKCNPGDGAGRSKITENPELWRRKYQAEFAKPLLAIEKELISEEAAKRSPILEMLQVVSLRFKKFDVKGNRELIIISDMLHNTSDFSMYRDNFEFEGFKKQNQFSRLRAALPSANVSIFMLMNNPKFQTRTLVKFWQDYFKDMGGSLEKTEPLPG